MLNLGSNTKRIYPFEVLLERKNSQLSKRSKAQCHQVGTISKICIVGKRIGVMNEEVMARINAALKLHMDLDPLGS